MLYNIYFEAAALAFLVIINIYIRLQYNSKPLTNRRYKRLALVMLIAVSLDIITAVTISYHEYVPAWLNMTLNFIYLCSDIVLEYHFVTYCLVCVYDEIKPSAVYTLRVCSGVTLLVLLINFRTGWVYSFGEEGYIHGPVYFIVHAVPLAAITASIAILFLGFKKFNRSQRASVVIYTVLAFSGAFIQIMMPDVLFTLFSVSLGFMTLASSLETPDFQALHITMEELRRARDEAEEAMSAAQTANQTKSEFLTGISHEIRTPINAIIGYTEAVQKESREENTLRYSENILSAGKTLLSMVNEIMDYTELEVNQFRIEETDYSSASFIMDILACGGYYTEKKNIEFRPVISENIPVVLYGDSVRLTQIINNLMSNSAKYTDEGYVELGVKWEEESKDKGFFSVYVRDTGIGMREEDVARISSSFLRMDKEHTRNIQGIGLGLTIVTRLLSYMDSRLVVESEYGKGTTVSFRVAQAVTDASPLGAVRYGAAKNDTNSIGYTAPEARLLAVDDNRMNLELICRALRETKASIDTGSNGAEAVELAKRNRYDVIFIDHMMPVMDGIEALKTIRENNICPGVPIIVVTANAVSGEREMYLETGFDDYVSKPVTSSRLCEVLRKHLPKELVISKDAEERRPRITAPGKQPASAVLEKLSFLNTSVGMAYCCDEEELYLQILATYADEDKSEGIKSSLEANDIENYRIQVHALKGTSKTIGADRVSEEARKLEMAARESDFAYIRENTVRVLDEYGELIERIKEVLCGISDT